MYREVKASVSWRGRDGARWAIDGETVAQVRAAAYSAGWRGHPGGFWNYLKDDLRKALAQLFFGWFVSLWPHDGSDLSGGILHAAQDINTMLLKDAAKGKGGADDETNLVAVHSRCNR
jgi:hypothetical protein